ncbi:MAG: serine/threonine protein kinase [Myxococcales bacterium]|nr:serine/threonine protein kinase [Myxococcales bacterium]
MGELFGPYELLAPLATGGMGQIYLARSSRAEGFQKLLVVKMMLAHHSRDEGFVQMFLDEARLAARLNHPNICHIFDLGDVAGTYYLAMEYVPGVDLRSLPKDCGEKGRPLPLPLTCRIIADAAAGLHYAHELTDDAGRPLGLVHRDISPSNVLVSFDGAVKLIDFGIAKATGRTTSTATGQLKGKFAYMSPEQAEGEPLDRRSDIYSLGLVFHELITGRRVLQRDSDTQTLKAARDAHIEPPSQLNPSLPSSIDQVLSRALAKSPGDRYATAQALVLAIEDWLLKGQKPASQSHLSGFLRELYPDHQERSRGPSRNATEDALASTLIRTPSSASFATGARASQSGAPPPRRPRALWGAMALLLGSAVGVAAIIGPKLKPEPPAPPPPPPAPVTHLLSVASEPTGASVKLDGALLGTTPLKVTLDAGTSGTLLLVGPGLVARTHQLRLEKDAELLFQLLRARVKVPIDSEPAGASVKLEGRELGKTPFVWETEPEHRCVLLFELEGYKPAELAVAAEEGSAFKATLEPLPAAPPSSDDSPFKTKGAR